jgi:hypothetical protein
MEPKGNENAQAGFGAERRLIIRMLTRRQFGIGGTAFGLLWFAQCKRPADYLERLRGILRALESGLHNLGQMSGLPAAVISQAANYLSTVAKFVDDTAHLLESTAQDWGAKAQQILSWGKAIVPPEIQGQPTVAAIIRTVQAAIEGFLSFFQPTPPAPTLSASDKALLQTCEAEAERDRQAVGAWAKNAK